MGHEQAHSINGTDHTGVLDDTQIPAAITRDTELSAYQLLSEKAAASGYASLDSGTKVPTAQLGTGVADATKVLRGDRSWAVPTAAIIVQEDDVTVDAAVGTVDFGHGLDVTSSPAGEANVAVDESELALGSIGGTLVAGQVPNNLITNAMVRDSVGVSVFGRVANTTGDPADIVAASDDLVLRRTSGVLGFGTVDTGGITDDAITNAKIRNSSGVSVIGRSANSTGDPADIVAASDDQVLRRTSGVLGFGTVDTGGITDNAITDAKLRDGAARSVIGRASGTSGDPADIAAAADDTLLGRRAGSLTFAQVATAEVADNAITDAKLRDGAARSVIGRASGTSGDPADIAASADDQVLRRTSGTLAFGTVDTGGITDDAITDAKIRNSLGVSVIGRSANSTGDPADIVAGADGRYLARAAGVLAFQAIPAADLPSHDNTKHDNRTRRVTLFARHGGVNDSATNITAGSGADAMPLSNLADAATQGVVFGFEIPEDAVAAQPLTITIIYAPVATDAVAHTIRWSVDVIARVSGDDVTAAGTTTAFTGASKTRTANLLELETTTQILASVSAGNDIRLNVRRLGADAADTYVGAIGLWAVRLEYTADA